MKICEIKLNDKEIEKFKNLTLIDSNNKFEIEFFKQSIIIKAKDYSSLRAGINALIKELIIMEEVEKRMNESKK